MTFLDLHAYSGVSMCRSDLKPSPACSPFNSEQDGVLLLYPAAIFSIRSSRHVAKGGAAAPPPPGGQEGPFRRAQRAEKGRRDRAKCSF